MNYIKGCIVGYVLSVTLLAAGVSLAQPILYGQPPVDITRHHNDGPPDTTVTIAAQFNARNAAYINQIVFGVATEAWAWPLSHSRLVGIEASTINLEPSNEMRKIAYWATFKNRMDIFWRYTEGNPANVDSQALRIESEGGTGFERGIVFAPDSLFPSSKERTPVVIDYKEVPLEKLKTWALTRYPDGWCDYYIGRGQIITHSCEAIE